MNIKKRLFASLIMASCITATAIAQPTKMTVLFNNGNAASATDIAGIASLHFSDGNMLVKQKADWQETAISIADILSIKFTDKGDGKVATNELTSVKVATTQNTLLLLGYDTAQALPATIYSIGGAMVYTTSAQTANSIDISSLQKGIYIFKLGNNTYKICK